MLLLPVPASLSSCWRFLHERSNIKDEVMSSDTKATKMTVPLGIRGQNCSAAATTAAAVFAFTFSLLKGGKWNLVS